MWNPITSPRMWQLMWLRIIHSGDWCLRLALRTPSGAYQRQGMNEWTWLLDTLSSTCVDYKQCTVNPKVIQCLIFDNVYDDMIRKKILTWTQKLSDQLNLAHVARKKWKKGTKTNKRQWPLSSVQVQDLWRQSGRTTEEKQNCCMQKINRIVNVRRVRQMQTDCAKLTFNYGYYCITLHCGPTTVSTSVSI